MPALIQNHRKNVAITSLKKTYSTFTQAVKLSEVENTTFEFINPPAVDHNADAMETWWNEYLNKYFNGVEHIKQKNWFIVKYNNGSGIGIKSMQRDTINMMVIHCINLNKCLNNEFQLNASAGAKSDGKNSFVFIFNGKNLHHTARSNISREELIRGSNYSCNSDHELFGHRYCSALIMHDSWQIKDDYPVRF